jgi:16S rRNA (guanine527-N7)-methyltransferase
MTGEPPKAVSAEPAPALARTMFGDRLPLACRYVEWLAGAGVDRGLVGPRETARLWDRHVLNCAAVGALIPPESLIIDIGSGAGLPGLVLAIARPDLRVVLVESMLRRTAFLEEVVADLGLDLVEVRRARAEEFRPERPADVVTARAIAPVDRLAGLAAPLLRPGGALLALKGANVIEEMAAGWTDVRRAQMSDSAELFAVRALARPDEGWVAGDEDWVAGVAVDRLGGWQPDGSYVGSEQDLATAVAATAATVATTDADTVGADGPPDGGSDAESDNRGVDGRLALVLKLRRGTQRTGLHSGSRRRVKLV